MKRTWMFGAGSLMVISSLLLGCACRGGHCTGGACPATRLGPEYTTPEAVDGYPGGSHPSMAPQGSPGPIPGGSGIR